MQGIHHIIAHRLPGLAQPALAGLFLPLPGFAGAALQQVGILDGLVQLALAERGVVTAGVVQNPVRMCAQFLSLPHIGDVDAESYRSDAALHLLQRTHQLAALLVGQGAGGIHHACKLHEPFAINLICLRDIISAGRARILRPAVNGS